MSQLNDFADTAIPVPCELTLEAVADYRARIAVIRIREDMAAGVLPAGIRCFAEMHEYVDANMYLVDEEHPVPRLRSPYEWTELDTEGVCEQLNSIMAKAEAMLASTSADILDTTRQIVEGSLYH